MRSRSTAEVITRGRRKAFVSRALLASSSAPPSFATMLCGQSSSISDSDVIPCWNHIRFCRASPMLAPMREGGAKLLPTWAQHWSVLYAAVEERNEGICRRDRFPKIFTESGWNATESRIGRATFGLSIPDYLEYYRVFCSNSP